MSTLITNKSRQALVVPLNSGTAIHLAPGETCDPLDDVETEANAKIQKMSDSGLISVATEERTSGRDESAGSGEPQHTRKKSKA